MKGRRLRVITSEWLRESSVLVAVFGAILDRFFSEPPRSLPRWMMSANGNAYGTGWYGVMLAMVVVFFALGAILDEEDR